MSTAPEPQHQPPLPDAQVMRATLAAALVPGAGHLLLGQTVLAPLLFAALAGGAAVVAVHLTAELSFFYGHPGSFIFGVLLRALALLHAFSVLDVYLRGVDPGGTISPPRRRWAVLLNMLLPGAGYIYVRAWLGAVSGLALVALFLWRSTMPYLDFVYIFLQLALGLAVYRRVRMEEAGPERDPGAPMLAGDPLPAVGTGQIVLLVASVMATLCICGVVLLRMPVSQLSLTQASARVKPQHDRIELEVPPIGLTMHLMGAGWTRVTKQRGKLFLAEHRGEKLDGRLYVDLRPMPLFMSRDHYLKHHLPAELHAQGVGHYTEERLTVGGASATQFRFSGAIGSEKRTYFLVVLPGDRYACMLTFYCAAAACPQLWPLLKKTRDSLKVEGILAAQR